MKDRFEYRGKRIDNGEWVTGYYVGPMKCVGKYDVPYIYYASGPRIEVDPTTVGQCTGLKDKNGKLIFEGDICKVVGELHPDSDNICVVRFGEYKHIDAQKDYPNGDVGFYAEWDKRIKSWLRNDILYWQGNGYLEVIGNIHDKSE